MLAEQAQLSLTDARQRRGFLPDLGSGFLLQLRGTGDCKGCRRCWIQGQGSWESPGDLGAGQQPWAASTSKGFLHCAELGCASQDTAPLQVDELLGKDFSPSPAAQGWLCRAACMLSTPGS